MQYEIIYKRRHIFATLETARAFASDVFARTGVVVAIHEHKPHREPRYARLGMGHGGNLW